MRPPHECVHRYTMLTWVLERCMRLHRYTVMTLGQEHSVSVHGYTVLRGVESAA